VRPVVTVCHDDGSTNEHDGQVWFYDPESETVTLKTIFGVNPDPGKDTNYDVPDNITVSPAFVAPEPGRPPTRRP
jgi:hypothetical protein